MDLRKFAAPDWWKERALKMVVNRLVATQDSEGADPEDDDRLFEQLLIALYPLDGHDGLHRTPKKQ